MLLGAGGGPFSVPATDLDDSAARVDVDTGSGYKAFPGMAYLAGRLHLVYRHATDHIATGDGVMKYRYSDDLGATWSSPVTKLSGAAGHDLRGFGLTATSTGRLIATYCDHLTSGPTFGALKVVYSDDAGSTWSSPYAVPTTGMAYESAGDAPIVELADHTLILPAFGQNASGGDYFSVLFKSTDDGATWGSQTTVAAASGKDYVEPYMRLVGTDLICFTHWGTLNDVNRLVSTDDGATWSTPTPVFSGFGRTDWLAFSSSSFAMWCRAPGGSTNDARWTVSNDLGLTWDALRDIDGHTDLYMYGAPVQVGSVIVHVYSIENSSTDADLYCRTYTLTTEESS